MFLLAGLGNPGLNYQFTKHNFGFLTLDQIITDYNLSAKGTKYNSELFSGDILQYKIIAVKPQTYMNLCGPAIQSAAAFYKITPQNIIVFHDDLDLPFGKVKVKIGGGHAGHNGLRSIDSVIGKNYIRVRLGIGRPENQLHEISDYVLSKFDDQQLKTIEVINRKISDLIALVIEGKFSDFMNKLHIAN